jgi:phosphate ABC transporter phosphate-binding protein
MKPISRFGGIAAVLAMLFMVVIPAQAAFASQPINGGGSTWSAPAIAQWSADVADKGLTVNYQATGSTAGRDGYIAGTYDFAVSEIPFQPNYCTVPSNPSTCTDEQTEPGLLARPYAYMPIVAGGTSLMYNLQIDGKAFTGLKLTPKVMTQIFTGVITNWNNPAIAAINPGVSFPNQAITPVVRSDGAGTSADITAFMGAEDPTDWNAYCKSQGIQWTGSVCPPTSQYPASGNMAAEDGSNGVADYVAAPYDHGSIGYVEAAYPLALGSPMASLQNSAGVYTQPTAVNVAVALTKAVINANNTENLTAVYFNPDPRTYPMSSYSYMIVPTTTATPFNTSKGQTLGQFILFFLCQGQQNIDKLGYSPLPPNLVQIGFQVEQQIPGSPTPMPLADCNNPTITDHYLQDNDIGGGPSVTGHKGITATSGLGSSHTSGPTTNNATASNDNTGTAAGGTTATTVAANPPITAATFQTVHGVTTVTATVSGANVSSGKVTVADMKGSWAVVNGTWPVVSVTATTITFKVSKAPSGPYPGGAIIVNAATSSSTQAQDASSADNTQHVASIPVLASTPSPQHFGKSFRSTSVILAIVAGAIALLVIFGPPLATLIRRRIR